MKFDRFLDELQDLLAAFACDDAPRKIRHVGSETDWAFLYDDHVAHMSTYFLKPACFNALLSVPGGTSTLGLPETVTVPGLTGW
ncbi:MAG: hypothetical protein JWR16_2826 [Nevskia sp.]|nr:hypothetical protein [Nevskia sp.]